MVCRLRSDAVLHETHFKELGLMRSRDMGCLSVGKTIGEVLGVLGCMVNRKSRDIYLGILWVAI